MSPTSDWDAELQAFEELGSPSPVGPVWDLQGMTKGFSPMTGNGICPWIFTPNDCSFGAGYWVTGGYW